MILHTYQVTFIDVLRSLVYLSLSTMSTLITGSTIDHSSTLPWKFEAAFPTYFTALYPYGVVNNNENYM